MNQKPNAGIHTSAEALKDVPKSDIIELYSELQAAYYSMRAGEAAISRSACEIEDKLRYREIEAKAYLHALTIFAGGKAAARIAEDIRPSIQERYSKAAALNEDPDQIPDWDQFSGYGQKGGRDHE